VTYVIYHFFPAIHSDEYCMVLVATIKVTERKNWNCGMEDALQNRIC